MNKIFLALFLSSFFQTGWAQDQFTLEQYFAQLAEGKKAKVSQKALATFRQNAGVVAQINEYLYAKQLSLKKEALRLSIQIGAKHKYTLSRQQMVNQLLKKATTAEATLLGQLTKGLRQFHRADFDQSAQEQLTQIIKMEGPQLRKWIELAGFLQMRNLLQELQVTFKRDPYLRQSIGIALTRCGDQQKRNNLMKNVAKYRVDDEFVYGILPKLVYARQKETTDYLFEIILEDQKRCSSPGPDVKGKINCAYRVMEALAPYVKGIPLQIGASGDLVTSNYQQSLHLTREWIRANQNDYQLNTDIY